MKQKLDMRGYSCPLPLLKTRDALAACDDLTVWVDDPAARENICKYAASQKYRVESAAEADGWALHITKHGKD